MPDVSRGKAGTPAPETPAPDEGDSAGSGRGRPTVFAVKSPAILEAIRGGLSRARAAQVVGINRKTLARWEQSRRQFAEQMEAAEAACQQGLLDLVIAAALSKAPNTWQAAGWALERRWPQEFGQRGRVDISIDVRKAIEEDAADLGVDPALIVAAMEEDLRKRVARE